MPEWIACHVSKEIADIEVIPPDDYANLKFNGEPMEVNFTVKANPTPEFDSWAKDFGIDYSMSMTHENGAAVHFKDDTAAMWFKLRWT